MVSKSINLRERRHAWSERIKFIKLFLCWCCESDAFLCPRIFLTPEILFRFLPPQSKKRADMCPAQALSGCYQKSRECIKVQLQEAMAATVAARTAVEKELAELLEIQEVVNLHGADVLEAGVDHGVRPAAPASP
ncbi:hypothetical protein GGTG_13498 [Gaeumannomyces tritici R3-111a-1]|uniref:Uncharacterized protein n=1 Tax=Gaeumannomyces tritici (strain R3-111a-1) TaxID=644352 RepID=J3PJ16_GAET3|nr:hypothetical protein GGTG_13498 [Gaeumannomyces tritici R3-111a-1]EJT68905.1 hypothetical protein GGTG_13498 [Gaeumannomyces tritici R3-111a-1]